MLVWLSFADGSKPRGSQFLGAVVVQLPEDDISPQQALSEAISKAWELDINPGGEVMGVGMHNDAIPVEFHNRLLSKQEIEDNDLGESTRR